MCWHSLGHFSQGFSTWLWPFSCVMAFLESSALSLLVLFVTKTEHSLTLVTVSSLYPGLAIQWVLQLYKILCAVCQQCQLLAVCRDISLHAGSSEPHSSFFQTTVCPLCAHIDICFRGTTRSLTQGRGEGRAQRVRVEWGRERDGQSERGVERFRERNYG